MKQRAAISPLLATGLFALAIAPAFPGDFAAPTGSVERAIVLAGGKSGGGMSGGGGMSNGSGGMSSGSGGMGGGGAGGGPSGGGMFRGSAGFDQSGEERSQTGASTDNYTYQCITPAGRCSFVAPAWLRANSLKSGADCACSGSQTKGSVE